MTLPRYLKDKLNHQIYDELGELDLKKQILANIAGFCFAVWAMKSKEISVFVDRLDDNNLFI